MVRFTAGDRARHSALFKKPSNSAVFSAVAEDAIVNYSEHIVPAKAVSPHFRLNLNTDNLPALQSQHIAAPVGGDVAVYRETLSEQIKHANYFVTRSTNQSAPVHTRLQALGTDLGSVVRPSSMAEILEEEPPLAKV
jgi:hypothetical protein